MIAIVCRTTERKTFDNSCYYCIHKTKQQRSIKLGTHHATFVDPTTIIVEWPAHTMRRSSNDRTHNATAVGCTHNGWQQLKQIANLADILYTNSIRSCLLASRRRPNQGCPIYGKIRFLRIFIACFSLRTKKRFMAESTDFLRSRYSAEKTPIFGRIYGFFRTEPGYYPPPPESRVAVFRVRRVNLSGCTEWTFSATTRNLRIFRNSDWATLHNAQLREFSRRAAKWPGRIRKIPSGEPSYIRLSSSESRQRYISRQNTTYRASISAAERLSINWSGSAMCVSYASRKCFTVIGLWPVGWCDRCLWPAHTMQQLLDRFVFQIGPTNCKINGRRSSLVRTHHATIVFSSSLRPTEDKNRMVCAGLYGTDLPHFQYNAS